MRTIHVPFCALSPLFSLRFIPSRVLLSSCLSIHIVLNSSGLNIFSTNAVSSTHSSTQCHSTISFACSIAHFPSVPLPCNCPYARIITRDQQLVKPNQRQAQRHCLTAVVPFAPCTCPLFLRLSTCKYVLLYRARSKRLAAIEPGGALLFTVPVITKHAHLIFTPRK